MTKTKILIYVISLFLFVCIVACTFFITISIIFNDSSMYNQINMELNCLIENLQKEKIVVPEKYYTIFAQEYYYGGIYSYIEFIYCNIEYKIDIVYLDDMYNIEVTFGILNPECLTEKETDGINKTLTTIGNFYKTNVFSPEQIKQNYLDDYFVKNYKKDKYDTNYIQTSDLFKELCSYKISDGEGSYTYRAHMTEEKFDFFEISACYSIKTIS